MKKWTTALLAALMCVSMSGCGKPVAETYTETRLASYQGVISASGDAYIPAQDGTVQKITGEIQRVIKTQDRAHIVVLEKDGNLYVLEGETKTPVASDVKQIRAVTNDGLLYTRIELVDAPVAEEEVPAETEEDAKPEKVEITVYDRYVFESGEVCPMGELLNYSMAQTGAALLYTTQNKDTGKYELRLIKGDEVASNVIISASNPMAPAGVNHDGSVYGWAELGEDEYTVYVYANGEREKAFSGTDKVDTNSFRLLFNDTEDAALILTYMDDTVAMWTAAEGSSKVKLPSDVSFWMYDDEGVLSADRGFGVDTVYVRTWDADAYSYSNLYAVTRDGMREKLANGIRDMVIRKGHLYYVDLDSTLYMADLSDGTISNEKKIADGVYHMAVSPDGTAVTYIRDVASDGIGALYYFAAGLERPVRIEPEAFSGAKGESWLVFSNDGTSVYYFTDGSKTGDVYTATLMQYHLAEDTSTRIGSDVMRKLESEYVESFPGSASLWYYKFSTCDVVDEKERVICDLMFWNGETGSVLANEVIFK